MPLSRQANIFSSQLGTADAALPAIPGGWAEKDIVIERHRFRLTLPADPDAFLDDPVVHEAHERDEYMPYWPYLWPAAYSMAAAVMRADWPARQPALEIGTGIGLVGLAALVKGLRVVFTDYAADAVTLALHNARQNGFADAEGMLLDWRKPPATRYPIILGCDVVYETVNHAPILDLLDVMLAPSGVCWIGDGGRQHGGTFCATARQRGWNVSLRDDDGNPLAAPIVGTFQLIELCRR
ncbi:MAG: hypothetical protein WD648_00130 [Planctomycetaceae bacterium]